MAKNNILDGFYNVFVNSDGVKNFGAILPMPQGHDPLVLFFLTLWMGWVSPPPIFCALTETVTYLTNGLYPIKLETPGALPRQDCQHIAIHQSPPGETG